MITFTTFYDNGDMLHTAFSPFRFPAGEAHTKISGVPAHPDAHPTANVAQITHSLSTMHDDLFQLAMWAHSAAATSPAVPNVVLMPYLPGARADRGTPNGAEIYAHFVADLPIDVLICVDPHSDEWLNQYEYAADAGVYYLSPHEFLPQYLSETPFSYDGVVAPDKGAAVRAGAVARKLGLPLYTAAKVRDFETGKLKDLTIELPENPGNLLVVDDICDGGGTFTMLLEAMDDASNLTVKDVGLYVTHGIFSGQALETLSNTYDQIFYTDSFDSGKEPLLHHSGRFREINITPYLYDMVEEILN